VAVTQLKQQGSFLAWLSIGRLLAISKDEARIITIPVDGQ